ncbi:hypothetical protein [Actinoallomurus sp. NPDC050550]|uniref:hypothetical protein n=1 Tax=Actinoallomurus sp. NPDC050550 TaxID=3154937 RepID=UPI0033D97D61
MTRSPRRLKEQVRETVSELPIHAARLAVMGVGQALLLTDRVRKDYKEAREAGLGPVLGRLRGDAEDLTGRIVGKVTGRTAPDERADAEEGPAPSAASSEIAVGKPSGSARTRTAAGRTGPSAASRAESAPAKGKPAAARAKGATTPASRSGTAARRTKAAETKTTEAKTTEAKPAKAAPAAESATSAKTTAPTAKGKTAAGAAKATAAPATPAKEKAAPAKSAPAAPAKGAPAARSAGTTAPSTGSVSGKELPIPDYDSASIASVRARLRNLNARQVNELRDYERAHAARADFLRMYENRIAKLRSQS